MRDLAASQQDVNGWRTTRVQLVVFITVLLALYWQTLASMVLIWARSDTFAHGFIIAPVSLWLVWQQRSRLKTLTPSVDVRWLLPVLAAGFLWLMGQLVDALVIQQLALVLLFVFGVCLLLGATISKQLAFPLAFLLFMVPMGENLIAPMMEFTASSTVWLIRQTGIPVYREGLFFALPSGNWSVVEACSGVRYLIASVTLGCLYAYLTFVSWQKRLVFIAFAVVVPVLANSVRAYAIVMIGHFSGMTAAVGVDHLIYGWVFFGFVMFLMFWGGSYFSDSEASVTSTNDDTLTNAPKTTQPKSLLAWPFIALLTVVIVWPGLVRTVYERPLSSDDHYAIALARMDFLTPRAFTGSEQWEPSYRASDQSFNGVATVGGEPVDVAVYQHLNRGHGAELVSSLDRWSEDDSPWVVVEQSQRKIQVDERWLPVEEARLQKNSQVLLAWRWYQIGAYQVTNRYAAKLLEALNRLAFAEVAGQRVFLVTPVEGTLEQSRERLQQLMGRLGDDVPPIEPTGQVSL